MALFTNRSYVKPMLRRIAEVVMVYLCPLVTIQRATTRKSEYLRKGSVSNSIGYNLPSFILFWIKCFFDSGFKCNSLTTFFGLSVFLSCIFSILCVVINRPSCLQVVPLIVYTGAIFTGISVAIFSGVVFIEFRKRFDLLAGTAFSCYNLFSHIRSLLTGLVKAAVGVQPVCGLLIIYHNKSASRRIVWLH